MPKLLDILTKSPVGSAAAAAIPGGSLTLKVIGGASQLLGKILAKKTLKAQDKINDAKAKLAQLESLQSKALVNRGTDQTTTTAQAAVFGLQPSEKAGYYSQEDELVSLDKLNKDGKKMKDGKNMEAMKDWFSKYWYYALGGAVLVYYMFGKKRR
jgi:hypothetical protein